MHARSEKGWPIAPRRLLLIVGALFLIFAAIGAMIVYNRSLERKKISINKIDQSAFAVPKLKAGTGGVTIPKLGSACFNPHLDVTVSSAKVSPGAIIRLSTPGVIGGFDYGEAAYQWTASAGVLTQDGRTASLDTRGIDKHTEISVRVTATGKDGLCKAKSQDKIIQVILPYTPTIISIEPLEVIPEGLPNLRRSPSLLCSGDRLRLRASATNERLRFEWQSTAGEISREGREVIFNTVGIGPGVHTVMVRAGDGFDSIPIAVATCTPRGPQLAACPLQLQPEITQKPDDDGILFSIGGVFPYPGNYKFNWSVSTGRIYGRGGVAWFDKKSDPFAENFEVQLLITGDQPQCRLTAGTYGEVVRREVLYRIEIPTCIFARNSSDLSVACRGKLKDLADDLKRDSGSRVYIDVYRLPGEIEGFELLRGREIRQFLLKTYQIEPARIFIRSGGISTFLSRDPDTARAELKFATANAPLPDGPAIVFFSEDENLPELKFQEEVTGSYPNRIETGRQETISIRFTRKLTELPLPSPTRTTQGDKTTATQPVSPVPGRDPAVILEEAMGRDFELWIRATLGSEQFEVSPATPETTEWRRLALAGEAQWDWTIKPRSDNPLQTIDASVEIEWRPKAGVTAESVRHTLWKDTLAIDVDDPLFKSDQIRIATPAFSVAGLAFIVIGAWPVKKKGGLTVDTSKIEEARAPDYTIVHAPHRTVSTGAFSEPPGSGPPEAVPIRAGRIDDESNKDQDLVECSVFAPPATVPAATIMVQVFAHLHEQAAEAERLALEFDEETRRRAVRTLASRISRGSELMFDLNISGWTISDPVQKLVWNGYPESVTFIVDVPADCKSGNFRGKVTVSQNSVPIGHISFLIRVADAAAKSEENEPAGIDAKRYSFVFISYASADRSEVLERVQMLDAMGIKYFQDLLSLDPGDRWEKKLYQNIDKCDLFLLFWSHHAKQSEWVIKEAEYALARKGGDDDAPPEIKPVIIEGPPIVLPPPSLAALHFNDRIIYLMSRK